MNKIFIGLVLFLMATASCYRDGRKLIRENLSFKEAQKIVSLAPKTDTIYVDSLGHTWYVYPKPDGMIILPEEDSTERQQKPELKR